MTESEVRKLLRQMKELDSQTAFRDFYNMTYDRLFRIAYYYVKQEEWSQEIVLDIFLFHIIVGYAEESVVSHVIEVAEGCLRVQFLHLP